MRPGHRLIGPKQIEARYGVPPSAWCCRAGLAGDLSDGIKGIPGIGPVTAARLLHGGPHLEDLPASGRLTSRTGQRVLESWCRDSVKMSVGPRTCRLHCRFVRAVVGDPTATVRSRNGLDLNQG
jgi:hypothetical protein